MMIDVKLMMMMAETNNLGGIGIVGLGPASASNTFPLPTPSLHPGNFSFGKTSASPTSLLSVAPQHEDFFPSYSGDGYGNSSVGLFHHNNLLASSQSLIFPDGVANSHGVCATGGQCLNNAGMCYLQVLRVWSLCQFSYGILTVGSFVCNS